MSLQLDHLVVIAPDLNSGSKWVADRLGVEPSGGGRHERIGTHNRVLRLGESSYLEVIAIDPEGITPDRPRWFGMDELPHRFEPFLGAWVARTDRIADAVLHYPEAGPIVPMSRGSMHWQIAIPADGRSPFGGAGPWLIEWPVGVHPVPRMPDHGLQLIELEVHHPEAESIRARLADVNLVGPVRFIAGPSRLIARISRSANTDEANDCLLS